MADVVDTIVAELIARDKGYIATFEAATKAHLEFTASIPKMDSVLSGSGQTAQSYADRHKKASGEVAAASEQSTERVKRAKKAEVDASIADDSRATGSAKKAAKEQADAGIAEAGREAAAKKRISEMVDRSLNEQEQRRTRRRSTNASAPAAAAEVDRTVAAAERLAAAEERIKAAQGAVGRAGGVVSLQRGESISLDAANARQQRSDPVALDAARTELAAARAERDRIEAEIETARRNPPPAPPAAIGDRERARQQTERMRQTDTTSPADVEAEREVDRLRRDEIIAQSRINTLTGEERREQQEILAALRLERQLRAQNVAEAEILVALDRQAEAFEARRVRLAAEQAALQRRQAARGVEQFAGAAGIGRGGGAAVIGGLAVAAGVGASVSAVNEAIDFAKAIHTQSNELGISTRSLQVYRAASQQLGVTQEQLSTGFGQFSANLGKAQEGAQQQSKTFKALGIDVGTATTGFKSVGEVLPTIIDRLSSIESPAQRAAIETALFGEEGRKLDGLLSGGVDKVNGLADAMDRAGSILSASDIKKLTDAGNVLAKVRNELEVDVARIVASNATEIEGLATSFGTLADRIGNVIVRLQQFNDQQIKALAGPSGQIEAPGIVRKIDSFANPFGEGGLLGRITSPVNTPGQIKKGSLQALAEKQNAAIDSSVQAGKVDYKLLNSLNAPAPKKGRGGSPGPSADQIKADVDAQNERLDAELLDAKAELTETAEDRASAANQRLDAERASYARQLSTDDRIDSATADALLKKKDQAIAIERQKIDQERLNQKTNEDFEVADAVSSARIEELQAQIGLAKTAKARRDLQDKLLTAENDRDAARVNNQINTATTDQQRDVAGEALRELPGKQKARADQIAEDQKGPLARYYDSLRDPKTQVEQAVADKLRNVDDAIVDSATKVLGVRDPLLKSLLQVFLEQNVLKPLYDTFSSAGAVGGGGGLGSIVGSVAGLFGGGHTLGGSSISGNLFGLLSQGNGVAGARAAGGPVSAGGTYLVGEKGPEIVKFGASGHVFPNGISPNTQVQATTVREGDKHYNISVNAENSVTPAGFAQGLAQQILAEAGRMDQRTAVASTRASSANLVSRQTLGTDKV